MKLMGRPGLVSLGGGLPSADGFPAEALRGASQRVLSQTPREALQYSTADGLPGLREWVAARLRERGLAIQAEQVLITSGSQQGLDLVAKILLEAGTQVAVESPTYLGALQAFAPYEAEAVEVDCDEDGPLPERLLAVAGARALYLLPSFQNPTGRCIPHARRVQIAARAQALGLPLLEDDPYGDLWFDQPPHVCRAKVRNGSKEFMSKLPKHRWSLMPCCLPRSGAQGERFGTQGRNLLGGQEWVHVVQGRGLKLSMFVDPGLDAGCEALSWIDPDIDQGGAGQRHPAAQILQSVRPV